MINYRNVARCKISGNSKGWIKKIWSQNLKRFHMDGFLTFDEEDIMIMSITKFSPGEMNSMFKRFVRKLDKAGKSPEGEDIFYILRDGRTVSAKVVFLPGDLDRLKSYFNRDLE